MRGRDIKKYDYTFSDLWLIYIPWHFPLHNKPNISGASLEAEQAFEKEYPAIYTHLSKYKIQLSNRNKAETGIRYEWYALQRWGANYMDDFSKQKIIWKRVGSKLKFCYDESEIITLDSTCFATGKFIKYLVAFLNSSIGNYLLQDSPKTGTGDLLVSVQAINPVFAPFPNKIFEDKINSLFQKMLQNPDRKVEDLINTAFYNLFSFSLDEIEVIEN